MDSTSAKGCNICNEDFDENERCPRNLPCFHCFCTQCVTNLIKKNDKKCPFCRQSFMATSAQNLTVNFTTLELLKYMKELEAKYAHLPLDEVKYVSVEKSLPKSRAEMVELMKENIYETNIQNITSLETANDNIRSAIVSNNRLKEEISVNHSKIQYEVISKLTSLANSCQRKMEYIDELNEILYEKLDEIEDHERNLKHSKEKLDGAKKLAQVDEAVDEAEAYNDSVQNWLQNLNMGLSRHEDVKLGFMKNIEAVKDKIDSLKETLDSSTNEDHGYIENMAVTLLTKNFKEETAERVIPIKMSFPKLDEIMAVQTIDGKTRYAKFSIYENKLCLHSLRDTQQIPPNVYTIQHSDVVKRFVDPSFRTSFMDLGIQDSIIGRILIRLTPDTKRANNFFLLSSAESGPNSYLNTALIEVYRKGQPGECVWSGDYEYNNGDGGKGVVEGAGEEEGGVLHRPVLAGSVSGSSLYGDECSSQFLITTRDNPGVSYGTAFGQVESGLNILREAIANYPNIEDVQIIDCGIVLDL